LSSQELRRCPELITGQATSTDQH